MTRPRFKLMGWMIVLGACTQPSGDGTQDASVGADSAASCTNSPECTAVGAYCQSAGTLVTCTLDADGCFVETATTCAADEGCTGSPPTAACGCANAPACTQAGLVCASATEVETCAADASGCLYVSTPATACPAPTTACTQGQCTCPDAGDSVCNGACTNIATDPNNCGACGMVCAANQACTGACACDPAYGPDPADGVFVYGATGDDISGLGTAASPYATIAKGIAAAKVAGVSNVYVGPGHYLESETISDSPLGVSIQGGWTVTDSVWGQDCSALPRANTVLQGGAIAVKANAVVHSSGFMHITIEAVAPTVTVANTDGASSIGVLVSGASSTFYLDDVVVVAADAGAGGTASAGTFGAGDSVGGGSSCGTGANGTSPVAGAAANKQGVFTATGFTPADGSPGAAGTSGSAGTPGGLGQCVAVSSCYAGNTCGDGCSQESEGSACGYNGYCGSGGGAGAAGSQGRGGGASVAVVVSGTNAALTVTNSSLRSGKGGAGSTGGAGGGGGYSSSGGGGSQYCESSGTCYQSGTCSCGFLCTDDAYGCSYTTVCGAGGAAGGMGGVGGNGSAGGGGAGGTSYSLVTLGGAVATVDAASTLTFGTGGAGGGSAPAGAAAATHTGP